MFKINLLSLIVAYGLSVVALGQDQSSASRLTEDQIDSEIEKLANLDSAPAKRVKSVLVAKTDTSSEAGSVIESRVPATTTKTSSASLGLPLPSYDIARRPTNAPSIARQLNTIAPRTANSKQSRIENQGQAKTSAIPTFAPRGRVVGTSFQTPRSAQSTLRPGIVPQPRFLAEPRQSRFANLNPVRFRPARWFSGRRNR